MKQILNKLFLALAFVILCNLLPAVASADTAYLGSGVYVNMSIGSGTYNPGNSIGVSSSADCSGTCTNLIFGAQLSSTAAAATVSMGIPSSSLLAKASGGGGSGGGAGALPSGYTTIFSVDSTGMIGPGGSISFTTPSTLGTYYINFADGHTFLYSIPFDVIAYIYNPPACGSDTTTCADGTVVGRVYPVCNFAACPALSNWVNVWADNQNVSYKGNTTVHWNAASEAISCYESTGGYGVSGSSGSFDVGPLTSTTNFSITCNWPDSFCSGTVAGSNGPYEGQNCSQFTSVDSCYQGWDTHGCRWGGTALYYSTCFISDTQVTLANGTKKNIQDVQIGDVLKGDKTNNTVIGFHQPKLGSKLLYSFNGGRFFVTAEHPFKTIDGWKSIDPKITMSENIGITVTPLKVGDTLITDHGNVLLKTIDSKSASADTQLYNFFLTGDHTYYADGYLVHNKDYCNLSQGTYCPGPYGSGTSTFCISGSQGQPSNVGSCPLVCNNEGEYLGSCNGGSLICLGGFRQCVQ